MKRVLHQALLESRLWRPRVLAYSLLAATVGTTACGAKFEPSANAAGPTGTAAGTTGNAGHPSNGSGGTSSVVAPTQPPPGQPPPTPAAPVHCAYPVAPQGDSPLPDFAQALATPGCRFELGEPIHIEVPAGFDWEFKFSYDVNGDRIGDLFVERRNSLGARTLLLFLSRFTDNELDFVEAPCGDDLGNIPEGRVFVRNLDGDDVPDLVIGTRNGVSIAFNRGSGFELGFQHQWSNDGAWAAVLDLAVADVDGNGIQDIAVGYDRNFRGEVLGWELGVHLLLGHAGKDFPTYSARNWFSQIDGAPLLDGESLISGRLAFDATRDRSGRLFLLHIGNDVARVRMDVVDFDGEAVTENELNILLEEPHVMFNPKAFAVWSLPVDDGSALAFLTTRSLEVLAPSPSSPAMVPPSISVPLFGEHGPNNEGGGGPERTSRFMIDADGDGDLDFIEEALFGSLFAIHVQRGEDRLFTGTQPFQVSPYRNVTAPTPFVAAGNAQAALIVNDSSRLVGPPPPPPSVQPLVCAGF